MFDLLTNDVQAMDSDRIFPGMLSVYVMRINSDRDSCFVLITTKASELLKYTTGIKLQIRL